MQKLNLFLRTILVIALILFLSCCTPVSVKQHHFAGAVPEYDKDLTDKALDSFESRKDRAVWLAEVVKRQKLLFPNATNFPSNDDLEKDWKSPRIISATTALYPRHLIYPPQEGLVEVAVLIDEEGNAADALIIKSTNQEFNDAAVQTVRKWKFKPSLLNNKPYKSVVNIPIEFTRRTPSEESAAE